MKKIWVFAVSIVLLGGVWSCTEKDSPLSLPEEQDLAIQNFIVQNGIDSAVKSTEDFYYYPLVVGGSVPNSSNIISFYYTLKSLDGNVIASHSEADGEPIKAERGSNTIYPPGLDEALQLLGNGDSYVFLFPSQKAYEKLELPGGLAPNSVAVIEVSVVAEESLGQIRATELQAINDYIADHNIANKPDTVFRLSSGTSIIKTKRDTLAAQVPATGEVTIDWSSKFLDNSATGNGSSGFVVTMGAGVVIEGLEEGLRNMRTGEQALLLIPSDLAYGSSVQSVPHSKAFKDLLAEEAIIPAYGAIVPPFTPLIFEVKVVGFQ